MTTGRAKQIAENAKAETGLDHVIYSDDSCNDFKVCSVDHYQLNGLHDDSNNEMITLV